MLVGVDEQIKRLSAARFQLDVMKVPGIIVARTDAEAATFLEGRGDERDHPFILGATNVELPTYKAGYLAILRKLYQLGIDDARGYLLYQISAAEHDEASAWLERTGVMRALEQGAQAYQHGDGSSVDALLDRVGTSYLEVWQSEANLSSYPQAVAEVIEFRSGEGERCDMSAGEWLAFASRASFHSARARAKSMGIDITWDCEAPKTPEGYYQIQSGIEYAVARSLAVASFADLLWMETKTANLADARGQHYFRRDRRPPGPQHPLGPGPEHLRGRPAPKAPDDAMPPVLGPPLQDLGGPLRQPHRRQPLPGPEDENPRPVQRRPRRGWPRHRRGRKRRRRQSLARPRPGPLERLDPA